MNTIVYTVQPFQQPVILQPVQLQPIQNPQYVKYELPPQTSQVVPAYTAPSPVKPFTPPVSSKWHTGLCDCLISPGICLEGIICPCCLYGKNNKAVTDENFCESCLCYLLCCPPLQHCRTREKLRQKYSLPASPCNDCCIAFLCGPCGLCQERREIDYRLSQPGQQTMA